MQSCQELVVTDTKIYGREDVLARLQSEAEEIASRTNIQTGSQANVSTSGYPNVGEKLNNESLGWAETDRRNIDNRQNEAFPNINNIW